MQLNPSVRNYIETYLQPWVGNKAEYSMPSSQLSMGEYSGWYNKKEKNKLIKILKKQSGPEFLEKRLLSLWEVIEKSLQNHPKGEYISSYVGFGASMIGDANGFTFPCHNNTRGICVDLQLSGYLIFMSSIATAHYLGRIDLEECLKELICCTLTFLGREDIARRHNCFRIPRTRLTPTKEEGNLILDFTNYQIIFVICHELGHVISSENNEQISLKEIIRYPSSFIGKIKHEQQIYSHSQIQEFLADKIAVGLINNIFKDKQQIFVAFYSITTFFCYIMFLNKIYETMEDFSPNSHPPASERLAMVISEFEQFIKIDEDLKMLAEKNLHSMTSILDSLVFEDGFFS